MRGECFPSPVAGHNLEFYFCTRNKLVRIPVEYRCVQEYVFATVVRRDKSVTAYVIELKYPTGSQTIPPRCLLRMVWLDEMDRNVMSCPKVLFDRRGAAVERAMENEFRW